MRRKLQVVDLYWQSISDPNDVDILFTTSGTCNEEVEKAIDESGQIG